MHFKTMFQFAYKEVIVQARITTEVSVSCSLATKSHSKSYIQRLFYSAPEFILYSYTLMNKVADPRH